MLEIKVQQDKTSLKLKIDVFFEGAPERIKQFVHMDFLVSPREAIGGYRYGLIVLDAKCRYVFVCPTKGRTTEQVPTLLRRLFVQDGGFPENLILDRHSPFVSATFADWCATNNVQLKKVPQARHDFNGLAENVIRVLQSRTTSALIDAQLPNSFWMFALMYSAIVRNRTAHSALQWKSPLAAKTGRRPHIEELRTFGCVVYKRTDTPQKFEEKAVAGIFVGIQSDSTHSTYTVYDPIKRAMSTRYIQDVRVPPDVQDDAKLHNSFLKGLSDGQKKDHSAILTKDFFHGTVEIKRAPKVHAQKPPNTAAARRTLSKQRKRAIQAGEPLHYNDIKNNQASEGWLQACALEDAKQLEIGTYTLVAKNKVPENVDVAGCKRVFKKKRDGRLKVRNTMKGNRQKTRLMDDFASPVVQPITMLVALQFAVCHSWGFATFDVEAAFLNAPLPSGSDVYMALPDGHEFQETRVAKLAI